MDKKNIEIPKILYGTAWKKEQTAKCVEMALGCGFRGIDTACQPKHYREDLVGEGLIGVVPLIGSTSKEHLDSDMKIFDFEIEESEIAEIEKLL